MDIAKKRIKLELFDESGDKITLIFEGRLTRDKIMQLADFIELCGGSEPSKPQSSDASKLVKVMRLIERHFPFSQFSSKDVQRIYEMEYREPIPLSTISTYLSRLADRGMLERIMKGGHVRYRILRAIRQETDEALDDEY